MVFLTKFLKFSFPDVSPLTMKSLARGLSATLKLPEAKLLVFQTHGVVVVDLKFSQPKTKKILSLCSSDLKNVVIKPIGGLYN